MKNTTQNLTDAEALLLILKMSEKSIKNGKAIPIKKAFKDLDKKIKSFKLKYLHIISKYF
jgi:hypothetical protein